MRVLLVDDDDDIRMIATLALERLGGHQVRTASSAGEALALMAVECPDLVVTDYRMPQLSGADLARRMQESRELSAIPLIFLTGVSDRRERLGALGPSVRGFIDKPFDPEALPGRIAALLAGVREADA